jgi:hypothetical protein
MKTAVVLVIALSLVGCRKDAASEQEKLEKAFAEKMTGSTLVGRFSSNKSDKLHEDRYTVAKVSKLAGDVWIWQARIQYGEHDVNVPVPVKMKWAGDTPVIELTDAGVPGMGKFTVRILFYRDEYAGTWSNDHGGGGQMFGRIEKTQR